MIGRVQIIGNYVHIIISYKPFVLLPTAYLRQKYIITIMST